MRIAFLVGGFPTLSETFILNQITGLLDLGHDVEIIANDLPIQDRVHSDIEKYDLTRRVNYVNMPPSKIIRLLKGMYLFILNFPKNPYLIMKSLNIFRHGSIASSGQLYYWTLPFLGKEFDVVFCHFGPFGNIGAYLKQIGIKGKLTVMFHGFDIRQGILEGGSIYQRLFKEADLIFTICGYNLSNLQIFGAPNNKLLFHPVGIDISKFPKKCKSDFILAGHRNFVILTIARLVEEKGLEYGIKAISHLVKKRPDISLKYNIIGGGPEEANLKKTVSDMHLNNVVCFLGPKEHEEVQMGLQNSDIFLLPSVAEALPVCLMEAQAVGLPVVATAVGSVDEIVRDGESGFIVPSRNPVAMAGQLEYLIDHPECWDDLGTVGRKIIKEKYDVKNLNKKLETIFNKLLLN